MLEHTLRAVLPQPKFFSRDFWSPVAFLIFDEFFCVLTNDPAYQKLLRNLPKSQPVKRNPKQCCRCRIYGTGIYNFYPNGQAVRKLVAQNLLWQPTLSISLSLSKCAVMLYQWVKQTILMENKPIHLYLSDPSEMQRVELLHSNMNLWKFNPG